MSDLMQQLLDEQEQSYQEIYRGMVVEGTVLVEKGDCYYVDLQYKTDGILYKNEVSDDEDIKPGDKIDVFVSRIDKNTGEVILSKKRVDELKAWDDIKVGDTFTTKAIDFNSKGLITTYKGSVRGFIPFSQLDLRYVSQDIGKNYVGQTFDVEVLDVDPRKRRLILSRKSILEKNQEDLKEETLEKLKEGKIYKGIIRDIKDYGLFVDIGGLVGLVHISEVSYDRHFKIKDHFKIDQEIEVQVISYNPENERLSLSIKKTQPHPWESFIEEHKEGDILSGEVKNIKDYGVFINLYPVIDGFVHISNLADTFVKNSNEVVKVGEKVDVRIINIDSENKKIELSMILSEDAQKAKDEKAKSEATESSAEEIKNLEDMEDEE